MGKIEGGLYQVYSPYYYFFIGKYLLYIYYIINSYTPGLHKSHILSTCDSSGCCKAGKLGVRSF